MRKDVRANRINVAAHPAVLVASTIIACIPAVPEPLWIGGGTYYLDMFRSAVVLLLALLVVTSYFKSDNPLDAREHWMSTPVNAAALWAGKVLATSLTTLLLWTIAQFIAVSTLGMGVHESITFLLSSSLTATSILLTVAVLAVVFPALKSTLTALIAYVVLADFISASLFSSQLLSTNDDKRVVVFALVLACVVKLGFLFLLYSKRWTLFRSRVSTVLVLTGLLIFHPAMLKYSRTPQGWAPPPERDLPASTTLSAFGTDSGFALRFALPRPAVTERVQLVNPVLKLTLRDGRRVRTLTRFGISGTTSGPEPQRMELELDSKTGELAPNAEFTADSVVITLRYALADSVPVRSVVGATVEFSTIVEWMRGEVGFDGTLDAPDASSVLTPHATTRPANDTLAAFQVSAIQLDGHFDSPVHFSDGSGTVSASYVSVSTTIETSARDLFVQKYGFPSDRAFVTYELIRNGSTDTLRLRNQYPALAQITLPIPLTVLDKSALLLSPEADLRTWDRTPWRNARLLIRRWTYDGHAPLHSTTRVQ